MCLTSSAQLRVKSAPPAVIADAPAYLYYGFWNPVVIYTGNANTGTISIENGSIKETGNPGRYLILPGGAAKFSPFTTVYLKLNGTEHKFEFTIMPVPYPKAEVIGPRNMDGMIDYFKQTCGVAVGNRNFFPDINYTIDSFTIIFSDSLGTKTHVNQGALWDSTTRKWLDDARQGTFITIKNVYVQVPHENDLYPPAEVMPFRQYRLTDELKHYIQ